MDRKDMIHIDDLVRGQLSGREEDERPGAWLHMRELLDKNIPAGTPVPFNWRRFGGYMALLSLLTVMVTGGYMIMQNPSGPGSSSAVPGIASSDMPVSSRANNTPETDAEIPTHTNIREQAANTQKNSDGNSITITAASLPATARVTVPGMQATATVNSVSTKPVAAAGQQSGKTGIPATGTASSGNNTDGLHKETNKPHAALSSGSGSNTPSTRRAVPDINNIATQHNPVAAMIPVPESLQTRAVQQPASRQGQQATAIASPLRTQRSNPMQEQQDMTTTNRVVNSGDGYNTPSRIPAATAGELPGKHNAGNFVTHWDTVEKINLVYRTVIDPISRARTRTLDTASVEQMVVEKQVPASRTFATAERKASNSLLTPHSNAILPAAGIQPITGHTEETAVQAKHSKQQRKGRSFQDMFMETRYTLSQAPFYLGITGGINAMSSGGKILPGIQLGLSGELELNERWSVYTELKYINRFNNGKTIDNPYIDKAYLTSVGATETKYARDSINHYFNFSTIGTGNLPITVKYSVNRLFLLAGVDIVYHFSMNAEEVSTIAATGIRETTIPAGQQLPASWNQPENMMQLNDLGARLGIGYLLGAGYKATPNLHLDLRLTHTLWDNAGTNGAKKVSGQLFKVPSLQFSLGYRLGGTRRTP